jgi:ribosomal-protein-alanine N-acetyltransferase
MSDRLLFLVEPMTLADLDEVMAIERVSFSAPWSVRAYRYEISENGHSTMLVVRPAPRSNGWLGQLMYRLNVTGRGPVLGYAGFWLLTDDAHIATIAVHPRWRSRGLGELLLLSLFDRGIELGARRATLEVRVSNEAALGLYRKCGLEIVSLRKRYYADNNEDAYIMVTPPFETPAFQANLRKCRTQLHARLKDERANEQRQTSAGRPVRQNPPDEVE